MQVGLWAEIRRLREIEKLSNRAIAQKLRCSRHTVHNALAKAKPPGSDPVVRSSLLDPFREQIAELVKANLSGVRILQEIRAQGYPGGLTILRDHLRSVRPHQGRVYQEIEHLPGDAMQVDWGDCGAIQIGQTRRRLSVFVAVLCYSRFLYIEFTLSQARAHFYRCIRHALEHFAGSPRRIVIDNLKAAVIEGSGHECRFHPDFLVLCAHYAMQPVACERRDPESKGIVENAVRYVKRNALAGRILERFSDYQELAIEWRDTVANVRVHSTTQERPVDRRAREALRSLPEIPPDTDEAVYALVSSHARIHFDANRYSVPPSTIHKQILIRADDHVVRVLDGGQEIARHSRSYERGQIIVSDAHRQAALALRRRITPSVMAARLDLLGPQAKSFRLGLLQEPVKPLVHLRKILQFAALYGRTEVLAALDTAVAQQTFDAAYVENLIHQQRRRRHLPSPLPLNPARKDLLEAFEEQPPDLSAYDRFLDEGATE
jgi:transposase